MNTIKKFINAHIDTLNQSCDLCYENNTYNVTMDIGIRDFNRLFNRGPRELACPMVLNHLLETLDKVCDKIEFTSAGNPIYTVSNQRIQIRFHSDYANQIPGRA